MINGQMRTTMVCGAKKFLKKNSSNILAYMGAAGVIATSVLTAKATIKATKLLDEANKEDGERLTKRGIAKLVIPSYIPAAIMGVATISCIIGSNVISQRKQASLIGAYIMLDRSFREYREKAEQLFGEGADASIRNEITKDGCQAYECDQTPSSDSILFFDEFSNRYFWKTMDEVKDAEYHLNRNLALCGYVSLNDFYELLGISSVPYGSEVGWSLAAGELFYGYSWIDFEHEYHLSDSEDTPPYYSIIMPFLPTADFLN